MVGRVKTTENIIKGQNMQRPTVPESFKVLLKELQALCLDMTLLDSRGNEIPMLENLYDPREEMRKFMGDSDKRYATESELKDQGFFIQKIEGDKIVNEEGGSDDE